MANIQNPFYKRAKRKIRDAAFIQALYWMQSDNHKKYGQTLYCASSVQVNHDGKTKSKYCRRRSCSICNAIRAQIRYNHYRKHLPEKMQFTTLTMVSPSIDQYPSSEAKLRKVFKQIRDTIEYRYRYINPETGLQPGYHIYQELQPNGKLKTFNRYRYYRYNKNYNPHTLSGVYNIETTINPETGTVHLHIHILHTPVKTWRYSRALRPFTPKNSTREQVGKYLQGDQQKIYYHNEITELWLKQYGDQAKPYLQLAIPLTPGIEAHKHEVFKYTTKPFMFQKKPKNITAQEYKQKMRSNFDNYIKIYDQLFSYQNGNKRSDGKDSGRRYFYAFNLDAPPLSEHDEEKQIATDHAEVQNKTLGTYEWMGSDWVNEYGETLADYITTSADELQNKILDYQQ